MSSAEILENLTGGFYQVKTDQGAELWAKKKARAEKDLEQSELQFEKIDEEITAELVKLNSLKLDRDLEIAVYQVVVDDPDATKADQDAARKLLQEANDAYRKQKVRVDYLEDIRGKWQLTANDAQHRLDQCELYPPEQVRYMWSADGYADYAVGDIVPVLDLFIEGKLVQGQITYQSVIAPRSDADTGWHDPHIPPREYDAVRDGYRMDQHLLTPAAWAYNVTIMPAVQQRAPRYRAGVVIGKDVCGLEVEHFKVYSSASLATQLSADPYDDEIVIKKYNARYGNRGLGAFQVGDKVVVKMFDGYEDSRNVVIGFLENPREPFTAKIVTPISVTQEEEPGTYTRAVQYSPYVQTVNNYSKLIREGRRVDVLWNGPDPEGNENNDWRQSERFYQFASFWDQKANQIGQGPFDPPLIPAPPNSTFIWTSGVGSGVNGVDTFHFLFYEWARFLPFSGVEDTVTWYLAQSEGEYGMPNIFYLGSESYTGFPGDPGQTRWQNRPIQCAIYVDGMLSETLAVLQNTTMFPSGFYDRVPGPNALMPWIGWPNDPTVCPVFKERDFSPYNPGFAYSKLYSGIRQLQADQEYANDYVVEPVPYEGPNQIEARVPGYTMKLPPLLCDIWPFAAPPYTVDVVYPDPWDTRETYRADLGGAAGP